MKRVFRRWQQPIGKTGIYTLALCVLLIAASTTVEAQQSSTKLPKIGFVQRRVAPTANNPDPLALAFRQGLRELGYIEGKNILIEHRYAGGKSDQLPALFSELIKIEVAALVVASTQAIRVARKATQTIPIVVITQIDPVAEGFVQSLPRPGGNVTGLTRLTHELSGKRLEVFKESIPRLSRVGILNGGSNLSVNVRDYEGTARALQIVLRSLDLHGPKPEFTEIFEAISKLHLDGVIVSRDALTASYPKTIADLAIKHRIPTMNEDSPYVEAGGLMSYAASDAEQFRRAAVYIDKILKGTKPADLPIEQPTKFELVINLKTAKEIGLTIPPNVLARADRVIR